MTLISRLEDKSNCYWCHGVGKVGEPPMLCWICHGTGKQPLIQREPVRINMKDFETAIRERLSNNANDFDQIVVDILAEMEVLKAENRKLREDNEALACNQCLVDGGVIGDDGGTFYCRVKAENEKLRKDADCAKRSAGLDELAKISQELNQYK